MALGSCPKCGAPVSKTWRTCPSCGAELDAGKIARENEERLEEQRRKEAEEKARHEQELREKREAAEAAARAEAERLARMSPEQKAALKAAEEARIRQEKKAKMTRIIALAAAGVIIAAGIIAYLMVNRPVDDRLKMVSTAFSRQDYPAALSQCEKVYKKVSTLNAEQICLLAQGYHGLAAQSDKQVSEQAGKRFSSLLRSMVASDNSTIREFIEKKFPDEVTATLLAFANDYFGKGKIGDAKKICERIYNNRNSLKFEDKCNLASLFGAIGKVENDPVSKNKCVWLFNQAVSFNESQAQDIFLKNNAKYGIDIAAIVREVKRASSQVASPVSGSAAAFAQSVIVTGTGVRLRRGPSLQAEILSDFYGKNIHPKKGEYLEYVGEVDGWYKVKYHGEEVWISKDYSTLVK